MFSNTQRHMPRASMPRIPSLKTALIAGMTIAGAMSMLPSTGQSAPSHFASPISELMSMRAPVWGAESASYKPLPQRSARQNELLNQAVSILTQGEASQSQARLASLMNEMSETARERDRLRAEMASTPQDPCSMVSGGIYTLIDNVSCRFVSTKSDKAERIRDLETQLRNRQMQIASEGNALSADLRKIGLDIKPEQVSGLMGLATAGDLVSLHEAYANLRDLNTKLREITLSSNHAPEATQRYFGAYTVMLEVAMHMHEEMFIKLRTNYIPQVDALTEKSARTYQQARALLSSTTDPELKAQLADNIKSLQTSLEASALYRETLQSQAHAISASWEDLKAQHEVAVNSYRTANISVELLAQMQDSGSNLAAVSKLEIPAIGGIGQAALSREFQRLTERLQQPNT